MVPYFSTNPRLSVLKKKPLIYFSEMLEECGYPGRVHLNTGEVVLFLSITAITITAAILGNALVMVVMVTCARLRKQTNLPLFVLSATDLCIAVVIQPLIFVVTLHRNNRQVTSNTPEMTSNNVTSNGRLTASYCTLGMIESFLCAWMGGTSALLVAFIR